MSTDAPQTRSAQEIRQWMVDRVATRLQIDPSSIRLDESLVAQGIDSMQFVVIVGELEEWLGCRFTGNPLNDYPTINALAEFLASQLSKGKKDISVGQDGRR